jgi:hypothetical protein
MSVQAVADKVASIVESKEYDFVMCNFAPPDMVRPPFFLGSILGPGAEHPIGHHLRLFGSIGFGFKNPASLPNTRALASMGIICASWVPSVSTPRLVARFPFLILLPHIARSLTTLLISI